MSDGKEGASERLGYVLVEYHYRDKLVVIDGVEYPIFELNRNHPALMVFSRAQLFDFAFDIGGEVRAIRYEQAMQRLTNVEGFSEYERKRAQLQAQLGTEDN